MAKRGGPRHGNVRCPACTLSLTDDVCVSHAVTKGRAMSERSTTRRRGAQLEDAILGSAWQELAERGYTAFTIDAVAKRARTSRPVLYRRWETKLALAFAGIAHHLRLNPVTVADVGNIRDELRILLRRFADRSPPHLTRLIFEMSDDMVSQRVGFTDARFEEDPMRAVLDRAVARGEIDAAKLLPRTVRLPTSLVLHEVMVTQRQITDDAICEIVDTIFLPLVATRNAGA
jgi:AcrR family transcriptional regulator